MKTEKVERIVTSWQDKTEYVIHIINLKQALNHGLILEKVYRMIKYNQNCLLKPDSDMNTKKKSKK